MNTLPGAPARLRARFARHALLGEAAAMLSWDQATMMPPGGAAARGEQLAALEGIAHEILTDPATLADLAAAEAETSGAEPGSFATANLRLMRRAVARAQALPAALVEARARAAVACETRWREARAGNDFPLVAAPLREVLELEREAGQVLGEALGLSPYDALLDGHQGGVTAADFEPLFAAYETFLAAALPRAAAAEAGRPQRQEPAGPFPAAAQRDLCRRLAGAAGLRAGHFRLDASAHPFCGGITSDLRITCRTDAGDPMVAVMGVLHETGHALYEQNLPQEWLRQPVGAASGSALHESQSLLVEMQACRSQPYLGWLAAEIRRFFPENPLGADDLAARYRRVRPSLIRVEADEVTYPAHVILRYRLERALLEGDLAVADLPAAWAQGMRSLLGIVPPDDTLGCLQDIHWYCGEFAHFPCYTLGAMAAAQLMEAARRDLPDLDASLARGDLSPLVGWMEAKVHRHGSRLGFNALLREATGAKLGFAAFAAHLTRRYLG